MCTLLIGRDVLPGTVILGANRDEDPARPSDPPLRFPGDPPIAGGRDRVAGGTWLALRGRDAAVALLNRRGHVPEGPLRSRGQLALEAAAADLATPAHPDDAAYERAAEAGQAPLARAVLRTTLAALRRDAYAPFTLLHAERAACWLLSWDGMATRVQAIPPGWHALTHAELDDPHEPRAAWLAETLPAFRPGSVRHAERMLLARLSDHGEDGTPPVCLHTGRMVTVSTTVVSFAPDAVRWLHVEGRPCTTAPEDVSHLLGPA